MADRDPIDELLAGYQAAVAAHDVDAFLALYDDHVRIFDMWGRWSYDGIGEWRRMVTDWFGSVGGDEVAVEFHDVGTLIAGDVVAAHAIVAFRGLSPEGEELRSVANRLTWVVRRTPAGAWKIVHEHTSAPIDLETLQALTRE
jgi:ketosteroid isomerase-like protein